MPIYVCMYACIYVCMYVCMVYLCMHVCDVSMHVCMQLLIASKFHDDVSMKNRDFASALNGCSMARFNQLEAKLLIMLNWRIHVTISEYTRKYSELVRPRDQSSNWELNVDMIKQHFSVCARHLVDDVLQTKNM